ncbi:MAG: dihydrofolate reductase [Dysgonamonadaceae bacterium]|jgi:dihydrofolate reductase|nr:dihydrofolate reductase [Dysgonamonadaceae bacterium]
MEICIIVAVAENGAIGKGGDLLWHIGEDLKRFKEITSGHPVIMGRKTWESLPKKPLPDRRNIVVTKNRDFTAEGAEICHSTEEVLSACKNENGEVFCIGGAALYREMLPLCDKLYITRVFENFEADTFMPEIDFSAWKKSKSGNSKRLFDEKSGLHFQFEKYERKQAFQFRTM